MARIPENKVSDATANFRSERHHPRKFPRLHLLLILLITLCSSAFAATNPDVGDTNTAEPSETDLATPTPSPIDQAMGLLASKSFKDKIQAIHLIGASGDKNALTYLKQLKDKALFYRKEDGKIVTANKTDSGYDIADAVSGEALGSTGKRAIKVISLNNAMRGALREAIAGLSLENPDPAIRLAAVNEMIESDSDGMAATFSQRLESEKDAEVLTMMETGIAIDTLKTGSLEDKLAAISHLEGSLHPSVRNQLNRLIDNDETEAAVSKAAKSSLRTIDEKIKFYGYAETLFFGLSLGSVLVLAAIGLAITFGVMGVINMAHGELIMLGAYTTYLIQQLMPNAIGWSLALSIPAAFVVSGLVGIAIERGIIRHLYGRPLETLLATFGVSLILQQLVRTVISPQNVPVSNPDWMSGSLQINPILSLTYNRLYIIVFCLMVFMALFMILKKTRLGLQVRAVSQNRQMARAMGVRSGRVDAMTFGLGSGIAGIAGVALSQLTNVGPNLGQAYIIDSFMVVVFGGVGNLFGTLVAGLSLGVANKIMEPWAGAVLAKILVLVFIILFIQKRPRGLFPQKGRAAEG